MSKMYNYNDILSLFDTAKEWDVLDHYSTQHYAIKFIFGELDAAKRLQMRLKTQCKPTHLIEKRIHMLKLLASTICALPIQPPCTSAHGIHEPPTKIEADDE